MIRRFFAKLLFLITAGLTTADAMAVNDSISYIPEFHGVFRGRWEMETNDGYSHFQVRNARLSVEGKVAPIISYKFQTDLCNRGSMVILDAFATITPVKGFYIKAGQYRMPFGIESFRAPGNYFFNNRSFIGRWVNNYRAVGASIGYTLPKAPVTIEGGVFNPTVITDHVSWIKKYAYAGKITYRPGDFVLATGFESLIPDSVRINLASVTVGWGTGNFYCEGEYMARWYTHNTHKTTHSYNLFANYGIPLHKSIFDTWSFQARFDGMSALASGTTPVDEMGKLPTTSDGRRRLTVGSTLDYKYRKLRAALRLNYEKYWYDKGHVSDYSSDDLLSLELIVKF